MSDTTDATPTRKRLGDDLLTRVTEALADERGKTTTDISSLRDELKAEIASGTKGLQDALDALTGFMEGEKKAREERDKVKDSSTTIVVPPSDVKPVQPAQDTSGVPDVQDLPEDAKPSLFKRIW